jgi:sugar phosphate isomerase/epimerase
MNRTSRRSFLKTTGAAAAVATIGGSRLLCADPVKLPAGLQLYSVRNLLPHDFMGTLQQLYLAGYREVEAAGYYDKTAGEFRNAMDHSGLRCVSTHLTLSVLRDKLDESIAYAHTLGLDYIICSSSGGVHRDPKASGDPTIDDWRYIASEFNRVGEKVKAAGMTFGVHNHTPEMAVLNGVSVYDELLRLTDPKLVVFEMDCGWVVAAGRNPVDFLSKTPERFPLLHVKDMARGTDGKFHSVVLGQGIPDYRAILHAATGLKHYFIEQEEFTDDPLSELREDFNYMHMLDL